MNVLLNTHAIIEDPDSSWQLDDMHIEENPNIRGLENFRVVGTFRNKEKAKRELNNKYSTNKEHMKIVNARKVRNGSSTLSRY